MEPPQKTLADYLAEAISPILIMLLVGSLGFFLIQVFYRGEMVHGVRWTLFWFVIAIVLVSRIGIQQGKLHARLYGAALAIAALFFLAYTYKLPVFGAILLAITWWCAHRLTVDCTLVREDNASENGVFQNLWRTLGKQFAPPEPKLPPLSPLELLAAADAARRRANAPPRSPGRSVIFFSLAALPLFGIGQLFLPADDPHARQVSFALLALYLAAAFGLLVTTSFLGLRRNLRRQSVEIPASVTAAWIKFGGLLAGGVLLVAIILPRPGVMEVWKSLTYRIPHKDHKARDFAAPFNPPGKGAGTPTDQPVVRPEPGVDSKKTPSGGSGDSRNNSPAGSNSRSQSDQPGSDGTSGNHGSSGRGRDSNDKPPASLTIPLKDVTPPGNADQPSDNKSPGDSGGNEPHGEGNGRHPPAIKPAENHAQPGKNSQPKQTTQPKQPAVQPQAEKPQPPPPPQNKTPGEKPPSEFLYRLLRALLILALAGFVIWLLIRFRKAIAAMLRKLLAALTGFFRKLFTFRRRQTAPTESMVPIELPPEPFATCQNPFVTGKDKLWPREHLLRYTYQAVQAWAKEQGIEIEPQQTPREFCSRLSGHFPEVGPELEQFSIYCTHAAFAKRLPDDFETESIRRLWQHLGEPVMVLAEPKP